MSLRKNRTMYTFWRLLAVFVLVGQCSCHFESVTAISQDGGCLDSNVECGDASATRRRHPRRDTTSADDEKRGGWLSKNFVMTDNLPDGEKEIRIHFNGVTAKETSVGNNGSGLVLRQFTDGRHFVQTILAKDGELLDCEYVDQRSAVRSFVRNFRKEIRGSPHINPKRRKPKKNYSERDVDVTKGRSESRSFHDDDFESDLDSYYDDGVTSDAKHDDGRQNWRRRRGSRSSRAVHRIAHGLWNVTIEDLEDGELPRHFADWLNFNKAIGQCDAIHENLRQEFGMDDDGSSSVRRSSRERRSMAIFPGTLWCGAGHQAKSFKDLGPLSSTDSCCRIHDHCPVRISALEFGFGVINRRPYTVSHCACDKSRSRRVTRNAFLIPGTKWCGKGNLGVKHNHLGEFTSTDRCCRKHDNACPFWIDGVSEKYGLFNWRPNTLMHCRCDERFRSCLKLADTDVANMVGRLFFNVVQTKCFVLKPVKVCLERSWWGKCLKKGYAKQAHLRDNLPY